MLYFETWTQAGGFSSKHHLFIQRGWPILKHVRRIGLLHSPNVGVRYTWVGPRAPRISGYSTQVSLSGTHSTGEAALSCLGPLQSNSSRLTIQWVSAGATNLQVVFACQFIIENSSTGVILHVCQQAHDSPVRTMVWSHNDVWMVTADHAGYVKYWQSNMNNVKMFMAHKEAIRGIR